MPGKLTVYPPLRARRSVVVWEGESLEVGRDPACDLTLDDPRVSRHHARLLWTGSGWRATDLGSRNGTTVNGAPAAGTELADGDLLGFGGLLGRFERLSAAQAVTFDTERLARVHTSAVLRRRLAADLEPGALLQRLLDAAREVTRTERGFVLTTRADGSFQAAASSGFTPEDLLGERFRGSVTAVRQALESGVAVMVSDVNADPRLGSRPSVVAAGIGSLACIPLRHELRTLGVIYVDSRKVGPAFTEMDLEILEFLAEHTARLLAASASDTSGERRPQTAEALLASRLEQRIAELLPAV